MKSWIEAGDVINNRPTIAQMQAQAKAVQEFLKEEGVDFSDSKCLNAISRAFGYEDWTIASARIKEFEEWLDSEFTDAKSEALKYPGLYASKELIVFSKWRMISERVRLGPGETETITVCPLMTPYFEPKAARIYGTGAEDPSINRRCLVQKVRIGHELRVLGIYGIKNCSQGLLSDVFNRSTEPLLVDWPIISTTGLARQLEIQVENINPSDIFVDVILWGNPLSALPEKPFNSGEMLSKLMKSGHD